MSEYLSKEEIKQWRSSLEKITLEEYAARLGKKIAEEKPTNDLADIVLHGQPVVSTTDTWNQPRTERITTIAQRAFDREQEIAPSPFSISRLKLSIGENINAHEENKTPKPAIKSTEKKVSIESKKTIKKAAAATKPAKTKKDISKPAKMPKSTKAVKAVNDVVKAKSTGNAFRDEIRVVFKKALTDREQKVFDYFAQHQNEVVYAKDLASLLDLPRDYVYKYIKNLRAKIDGEKLENADKGGFILHV